MPIRNRVLRLVGLLLFIAGILLGMAFTGGSIWGDMEASLFDTSLSADQTLPTLRCPLAISNDEVGLVTARISNKTDKQVLRTVRTHISQGLVTLMSEQDVNVTLAPGEAKTLEWTVKANDAVWGRIVMVRVFMFRRYPLPGEAGYCGILVLDWLSLKGWQIVAIIIAASLSSILAGLTLWVKAIKPLEGRALDISRAMITMAALLTAATLLSLFSSWILSGLLFLGTILMIAVMVGYYLFSPSS